jgi:hypothetical protein
MKASILLLYTKATGHVLKTATVAAPPNGTVKPEALAGELLPLRDFDPTTFAMLLGAIPGTELAVHVADADAAPISQFRSLTVDPKDQTFGMIDSANSVQNATLDTANRNKVTVTVSAALTKEVPGLLRIARTAPSVPADPADVQLESFTIGPAASPTATVHLQTLPPGSYNVLTLVQGLRPDFRTV